MVCVCVCYSLSYSTLGLHCVAEVNQLALNRNENYDILYASLHFFLLMTGIQCDSLEAPLSSVYSIS